MRDIYSMILNLVYIIFCIFDISNALSDRTAEETIRDLKKLSPVILIPGCGGNKLKAKLNKPSVVNFFCHQTSDSYDLWMDPFQMIPYLIQCWVDNMRLTYDNVTRSTRDSPGVDVTVPGWTQTTSMEWIDSTPIISNYDLGAYFTFIVEALVYRGYNRGESLFGAPYDFRKGPYGNQVWFDKLRLLTEAAFSLNQEKRVTFICHSMGGKMLLQFLQQMPTSWKGKYVEKMITLSTPWGGSMQAVQAISVGYDFGSSLLQNYQMKLVQQSCPSLLWLLPSELFWKPDEILVTTKYKNYTVTNIDELFLDINLPNSVEMRKDLLPYNNFTAPGVEVHCLYGINKGDTVERMDFGDSINPTPTLIYGDGDGTVNKRSLIGCGYWQNVTSQGNHAIYQHEFPDVEHYNLLKDSRLINYILNQLLGAENYHHSESKHNPKKLQKIRIF